MSPWFQIFSISISMRYHLERAVPKAQRRPVARPLIWYFKKHRDRDAAIFEAFTRGGYNMREIGDHVGLHYSRISRIVSLIEKARGKT